MEWYSKIYDAWLIFQVIFIPLGALISVIDLCIKSNREKTDNITKRRKRKNERKKIGICRLW